MKILKIGLIAIGVLFVLVASVMVLAVMLLDPNDYKDDITTAAQDATGRELLIEGDIRLSVFPWLGLKLGRTQLDNAKNFTDSTFAEVDGLEIRIALLPLFKMKAEVGEIRLDGLRLNLERNKDGMNNWDDLAQIKEESSATQQAEIEEVNASGQVPEVVIGGVTITNANIQWRDGQAGTQSSIEKFNLETGRITLDKAINFKTDFIINNSTPKTQAVVRVSGEIAMDMETEQYALNNIDLAVQASGDEIPNGSQNLTVKTTVKADLKQQTASINPLQVSIGGLVIDSQLEASQIQGDVQATGNFAIAEFSPRKLMAAMGAEVPDTADKTVLSKMQIAMAFNGSTTEVALSDIKVLLDDTNITGDIVVKNINKNPALRVKLAIDQIDADRYLSPVLETDVAATESTSTGDEPIDLPMETLRELDAVGELSIGTFKMMNLTMQKFVAQLLAKEGVVTFKPLDVDLYEGSFRGDAVIDASQDKPRFAMSIKLADVNSMPLVADYLQDKSFVSGRMNLNASITTQGNTVNSLKKVLNGKMDFQFKDGALQGVNINEKINESRAFFKGEAYTPQSSEKATNFGSLSGQADIINGVVNQKSFILAAPTRVQMNGSGTADLNTEKLDYRLQVSYFDKPEDTKAKSLPLKIKGTFTAPDVGIDFETLRKQALGEKKQEAKQEVQQKTEEATEKAKDKLKDKLKKKLKF